jgi:hypothetical protein
MGLIERVLLALRMELGLFLKLLVHEALSYVTRPQAITACGLKLLVYAALSSWWYVTLVLFSSLLVHSC